MAERILERKVLDVMEALRTMDIYSMGTDETTTSPSVP